MEAGLSEVGVEIGDLIGGNLLVESRLGTGGMAEVYQVRDITVGTRHALKILASDDTDIRTRILKEGALIRTLDNPFIVKLHGEMRVNGHPALLMERIRGPTLGAYLKLVDKPPLKYAMALFRGICMGVGHAHAMGVVHRDLKPGNVLLDIDGLRVLPKVVDFGVAKDLIDEEGITLERMAMGTPRYMAPEQFDDSKAVDRRADMWALGIILYRMVCGELPFNGDRSEIMLKVLRGKYTPPKQLNPRLPVEVVFAIDELLKKDVTERISDVPALFGLLDGATALARDVNLGELKVTVREPFTKQATALPLTALPQEMRYELEEQAAREAIAEEASIDSSQAAPAPPSWVGLSTTPRTGNPDDFKPLEPPPDDIRIATAVPAARRVNMDEPPDDEATDRLLEDVVLGAAIGGIALAVLVALVIVAWTTMQ